MNRLILKVLVILTTTALSWSAEAKSRKPSSFESVCGQVSGIEVSDGPGNDSFKIVLSLDSGPAQGQKTFKVAHNHRNRDYIMQIALEALRSRKSTFFCVDSVNDAEQVSTATLRSISNP